MCDIVLRLCFIFPLSTTEPSLLVSKGRYGIWFIFSAWCGGSAFSTKTIRLQKQYPEEFFVLSNKTLQYLERNTDIFEIQIYFFLSLLRQEGGGGGKAILIPGFLTKFWFHCRFYSLDDSCRTIYAGTASFRNEYSSPRQLGVQFCCWILFSDYAGNFELQWTNYFCLVSRRCP